MEAVAGTESPLDSSLFDVAGFLAAEMQGACACGNLMHVVECGNHTTFPYYQRFVLHVLVIFMIIAIIIDLCTFKIRIQCFGDNPI